MDIKKIYKQIILEQNNVQASSKKEAQTTKKSEQIQKKQQHVNSEKEKNNNDDYTISRSIMKQSFNKLTKEQQETFKKAFGYIFTKLFKGNK